MSLDSLDKDKVKKLVVDTGSLLLSGVSRTLQRGYEIDPDEEPDVYAEATQGLENVSKEGDGQDTALVAVMKEKRSKKKTKKKTK